MIYFFRNARRDCTLQIRQPLHTGSINALAAVQNDIVVSAGADKVRLMDLNEDVRCLQNIIVQDLDSGGFITKFLGHEGEITKVSFIAIDY
jgi:WD40 repeat protein